MTDRATFRAATARGRPGFTLMELVLVVAILGVIMVAAAPLIQSSHAAYDAASPVMLTAQEGSMALAHVAAAIRQAAVITAAADDGAGVASLSFLRPDGVTMTLSRASGSNNLMYGATGSTAVLSGNCTALAVHCYTPGGTAVVLPVAAPAGIGLVEVGVTVADAEGRGTPAAFTTRAAIRRPLPLVVINEIMYSPSSAIGPTGSNRWVELYNVSPQAVDVGNWRLWTTGQSSPDTLLGDKIYTSTGSTVIPPGGYAIITDQDSDLYKELLNNGDFELSNMGDWHFTESNWGRVSGDAYAGSYKLEITGNVLTAMYQDFKLPSGYANPRVRVRAKLKSGTPALSRMVIRITNRSNGFLATLYDGPISLEWTEYSYDLSAWVNQDLRLRVTADGSNGWAQMDFDAITIYASRLTTLPYNCQHLWVNDNNIGDNLSDGHLFISDGTKLRTVAVYSTTWGGNGTGGTLTRVSPWYDPTVQSTWREGPYGGTPASAN